MKKEIYGMTIKTMRQLKGLSQSDYALLLDVNQSTVSRLENGEINDLQLYSKCLSDYGITLSYDNNTKLREYFQSLLEACLDNDSKKVKQFFELMNNLGFFNIEDYFYLKLAEVFLNAHLDNYDELNKVVNYITHFSFLFSGEILIYYHMARAYSYIHQQKHEQSVVEFQKAYEHMMDSNKEIPILIIVYSLNKIIVRHFAIGYLALHNALNLLKAKPDSYGYYTIIKHIGTLHALEGNFKEAIPSLLAFYQHEDYLKSTNYFKMQMESFLGYCFLHLGVEDKALEYFTRVTEEPVVEILLEGPYLFILYLLRSRKDKKLYQKYLKEFKTLDLYKNEPIQKLYESLLKYDGINIKSFINNYPILYENIFKHSHKYSITRSIFFMYGESIWKKRAYSIYKSLFDIMIKAKFGSFDYEL